MIFFILPKSKIKKIGFHMALMDWLHSSSYEKILRPGCIV